MQAIPPKLKDELANDQFYKRCCLCGSRLNIQWHHNLIFGGKQQNIKEAILPLCDCCHDKARETETKEKLDLIMLSRMSEPMIKFISKAMDYVQRYKYLKKKYGLQTR